MNYENKNTSNNTLNSSRSMAIHNNFNLKHFAVGALMINIIAVISLIIFKNIPAFMYLSQYIAPSVTGLVIGYWAGQVQWLTLFAIIASVSGKIIIKLFNGQLGNIGSFEFNFRLISILIMVCVLVGFTHLGAKYKNRGQVK